MNTGGPKNWMINVKMDTSQNVLYHTSCVKRGTSLNKLGTVRHASWWKSVREIFERYDTWHNGYVPTISVQYDKLHNRHVSNKVLQYARVRKHRERSNFVQCCTCHRKVCTEGHVSKWFLLYGMYHGNSGTAWHLSFQNLNSTNPLHLHTILNKYFSVGKLSIGTRATSKCVKCDICPYRRCQENLFSMTRANLNRSWMKFGTLIPCAMCHYGDVWYDVEYCKSVLSWSTCPINDIAIFYVYMYKRLKC